MGGSYSSSCSSGSWSSGPRWETDFQIALRRGDAEHLLQAYRVYLGERRSSSGFISELARLLGIAKVENIPKEFPDLEYEVKFSLDMDGVKRDRSEPSVLEILSAFDFPPASTARFLKDPVNAIAEGINRFYGTEDEEHLVVIEKGGGFYLKEKSDPLPIEGDIPHKNMVMKREESRYPANQQQVLDKIHEVTATPGVSYRGRIRKEKGDAFILDTSDGRIYSFTITRAHLIKPGEEEETDTQRQLELEYAGYLPFVPGFERNSEAQLVRGMVDLARYIGVMYATVPFSNGCRMSLCPTQQRKHDFVVQPKRVLGGEGIESRLLPN